MPVLLYASVIYMDSELIIFLLLLCAQVLAMGRLKHSDTRYADSVCVLYNQNYSVVAPLYDSSFSSMVS
jgi:hypothetical protein